MNKLIKRFATYSKLCNSRWHSKINIHDDLNCVIQGGAIWKLHDDINSKMQGGTVGKIHNDIKIFYSVKQERVRDVTFQIFCFSSLLI